MWIKFDNDILYTLPPEGVDVMTTDGESVAILYYLCSSEYRWINLSEELDDEIPLPFQPTHWMTLEDYKIYQRETKIDYLLSI